MCTVLHGMETGREPFKVSLLAGIQTAGPERDRSKYCCSTYGSEKRHPRKPPAAGAHATLFQGAGIQVYVCIW